MWFWTSLVLFAIPWFISEGKGVFVDRPYVLWLSLFTHFRDFGETEGAVVGIVTFSIVFSVPAICIGWVFQCLIVLMRGEEKSNTQTQTDTKREAD